jgi:predicted dehydrogenase
LLLQPNKKRMNQVRIGCFGNYGHQVFGLVPTLQRARLTAVSGVTEEQFGELQKGFQALFSDVRYYPDPDVFLKSTEVDLVSFCSERRDGQTGQVVQALRAGKHVLAEKPMAMTLRDLESLRQAARESGKEIRTMNPMVYLPSVKGMKNILDAGKIGTIVQVYAMKSYPYFDARPQDEGVDGGLLMQTGIHAVSVLRHVTGLEFSRIFAEETTTGNPKGGELKMGATIHFQLSNGALGVILCNYCNRRGLGYWGNDQFRIHGTAGMVELVDGLTRRQMISGDGKPEVFPDGDPGAVYLQDLVDCILDGTPTLLTQEDSFRNTEIVLLAKQIATTGKIIHAV